MGTAPTNEQSDNIFSIVTYMYVYTHIYTHRAPQITPNIDCYWGGGGGLKGCMLLFLWIADFTLGLRRRIHSLCVHAGVKRNYLMKPQWIFGL